MSASPNSLLEKINILHIDRDSKVRNSLKRTLPSKVYSMADVKDGFKTFLRENIDIIIIDRDIEDISLVNFLKKINSQNRDVKTIITSDSSESEFLLKLINLEINFFLKKPLEIKTLLSTLIEYAKVIELKRDSKKRELELIELNDNLKRQVESEVKKNRENTKLLELQSRQAQMGEMLESIAHQWKQPLSLISMTMHDLAIKSRISTLSNEKIESYKERVVVQVKYMSNTIDDFKNFFKPSNKRELFDIEKSIYNVLDLIGKQYIDEGITIEIDNRVKDGLFLNGYLNEFQQVIINLLNNAKDAMREREVKNKRIDITLNSDSSYLYILIEDNGGGVKESILDRVFEPYNSTKGKKGTGIGLYMSKTIIEKIDGEIYFENIVIENLKIGAKFTIKVPKYIKV